LCGQNFGLLQQGRLGALNDHQVVAFVVFADEPGGLPLGMRDVLGDDHAAQVQVQDLRRGPSSGISFVLAPTSRWAMARPSRTQKADSRWTSLHLT